MYIYIYVILYYIYYNILQYSRVFRNFPSLAKRSVNQLFEFVFLSQRNGLHWKQAVHTEPA